MDQIIIGCTTRPYAAVTLAEACERIAAAGYTDVAVFQNSDELAVTATSTADQIAAVRQAATAAGVKPSMVLGGVSLEQSRDAAFEDFRRLLNNTAAVGAKWLLQCGTEDESRREMYYALLERAAPVAAEIGVGITLKPHGGVTLNVADLLRAAGRIVHPGFGICYDPGNIIYYTKGAERPEPGAARIASHTTTAIVKDCVLNDGVPDVMVTPGDGLVDFRAVFAGLCGGGFHGPCYVECVGGSALAAIDANLKATLDFVRQALPGSGPGSA